MLNRWFVSSHVTRFFLASVILLFLLIETMVMIVLLVPNRTGLPLVVGYMLASLLVISVPGVVAIKGYYAVSRLQLTVENEVEKEKQRLTLIWLSRQFLVGAISAYSAIILSIVFFVEVVCRK